MKKILFISLIIVVGTVFYPNRVNAQTKALQNLFKASLPKEFIVEPDPDNPYQGTWLHLVKPREYGRTVIAIVGTTATIHIIESGLKGWSERETFYDIDKNPEFRLSEDKNTLQRMIITYGPDNNVRSSKLDSTFERY
jgi:hypothetical protein